MGRKRAATVGKLARRCRQLDVDRQAILLENHAKANLLRERNKKIDELEA